MAAREGDIMAEQYNQKKIIKWFRDIGGTAITGTLPSGEADIQAGYPFLGRLINVMVEVKDEPNYHRVMRAVEEVNGLYVIIDKVPLKKHESLQIYKLNNVRKRGGLALFAYSVAQVVEYLDGELNDN